MAEFLTDEQIPLCHKAEPNDTTGQSMLEIYFAICSVLSAKVRVSSRVDLLQAHACVCFDARWRVRAVSPTSDATLPSALVRSARDATPAASLRMRCQLPTSWPPYSRHIITKQPYSRPDSLSFRKLSTHIDATIFVFDLTLSS